MGVAESHGYRVDVIADRPSEVEPSDLEAYARRCLRAAEGLGATPGTFTVRLVDDVEMAGLNERYRGKAGTTDVLSFPGEETLEGRHLGDVVVSIDTAARQAADEGHSLGEEVRLLILHGTLHCLGYDHDTDDGEMDAHELALRARLLTAPRDGAHG